MDNNDMIIEPEKKNKYLIIAIVIIGVIALGLGGYVVYNKMIILLQKMMEILNAY